MRIIGFAGRRCSGKTKAAEYVVDFGIDICRLYTKASFSSSVIELFCYEKSIDTEMMDRSWAREEYLPQFSEFIEKKRSTDRFYFEKFFFDNLSPHENVAIDDVSTIEQLEAIYRQGGRVYKIQCDMPVLKSRGWSYNPEIDDSIYERELGDLDPHTFVPYGGYIYNNGDNLFSFKKELYNVFHKELRSSLCKI